MQTADLCESLRRLGLLKPGEAVRETPLTGGVSSEISLVEAGERRFCVKRALPRLKVAALWEAPIERNAADPSTWGKVARNEACPCGSGKRFKHCHGRGQA